MDMDKVRRKEDANIVGMEAGMRATVARGEELTHEHTIEEDEEEARQGHERRTFVVFVWSSYAALKVFFLYFLNIETMLVCGCTAGLTWYWWDLSIKKNDSDGDSSWFGGGMDTIILSFAVITPLTTVLGMAFNRREKALFEIARFRSFSFQLYIAHSLWDWSDNGGRAGCTDIDWLHHSDNVLAQLVGIGDELSRFLSLPTSSRTRHRMTRRGQKEAAKIVKASYRLFDSLSTQRMTRLSTYAERIKAAGLNPGELSRIRQYERFINEAMENLRMIKTYRTPQSLRSFGRVFTICLPPFFAPTYAQIAREVQSLGVGMSFGVLIALCLSGLFESIQVLEDPFVAFLTLDGINVSEEFEVLHYQQLVNAREMLFPDAPPFPKETRTALTSGPEIPELAPKPGEPKHAHKRVVSWDHQNLSATGFGSYAGELIPPPPPAGLEQPGRDRLTSEPSIRVSHFARDDEEESPSLLTSPLPRRKKRASDHSVSSLLGRQKE